MPFNTLGNLGAGLMLNYNDQPTPDELMRLLQSGRQNRALAGIGMPVYDPPTPDRNAMQPNELNFYNWLKSQGIPYERP